MNDLNPVLKNVRRLALLILFLTMCQINLFSQTKVPMRRPISPEQPMWLMHIDTWNWPDPQKVIDLIPKDIRPYVVMNISLSISHDTNTGKFNIVTYGYETARSWLRVCAENGMWATVQCASGGFSHFSETDLSVYEEFYREYPNFIGWNYAEQFWGFDDRFSCSFPERIAHFVDLMKLSDKYGGYLIISFCGEWYGASLNPLAMMKRFPDFAAICKNNSEHLMICEKFTSANCFYDNESVCFGSFVSGYAGTYGIRFDQCGWENENRTSKFPEASGAIPVLSHMMLTGQTVTDGPELIWQQDVRELSATTTADGYTTRRWGYFPQYNNISIDIFRKILDKTVRIPSRKEVIDRTKVVIVNNVLSGNDWGKYATPGDLFDGLYNMDGKQMQYNTTWFKKTGRYPTIPTVYTLADSLAKTFQVQVKKTQYATRWKTVDAKVNEFDTLFPEQYTGDIFADRMDNTWMTYNPYMDENKIATGTIPFKYNTCDRVDLFYSQFTMGVMKEYADKLTFYLTNYRTDVTVLKTDTIRVYGCQSEPVLTWKDRAKHSASKVTSILVDGIYTITVKHNGPLDIEVTNIAGAGTDRLTDYIEATIITPAAPPVYTGPHQYEAECFDYKNVASCKTNGVNTGVSNYTGQGYMDFGTGSTASIRDTISVPRAGKYRVQIRYSAPYDLINNIDCFVNSISSATPEFAKTASVSVWRNASFTVDLKAGKSVIELRRKSRGINNKGIYFDHIVVEQSDNLSDYTFEQDSTSTEATTPVAEMITVQSGSAGIVQCEQEATTPHCFKSYTNGSTNNTGVADLDLYSVAPYNSSITWKGYGTAGNKTAILMRGSDSCNYATGMKQGYLFVAENNADNTVTLRTYIATAEGITEKSNYTSRFVVPSNSACWYRAVTFGTQILFECSSDGKSWQGGAETAFTDARYERGAVQLLWGMGSNNGSILIDQISKKSSDFTINRYALNELRTQQNKDTVQVVYVSGRDLVEGITVTTRRNFEVSLSRNANFSDSLVINPSVQDTVDRRAVYIRLNHSSLGIFEDTVTFRSKYVEPHSIALKGELLPTPISMIYDFESDAASSVARTPPATYVTVGKDNTTKAGVVAYTDQSQTVSNKLKIYSCTSRKNSGVLNLTKFKNKSTDYSVTWKMCLTSSTESYKNGVILRGDTTQIGTTTTGYTPGVMSGYAFVAYNNHGSGTTEFRIYKSDVKASQELTMLANAGTSSLNQLAGQSVWYRATVSGSSSATLFFEYSTDGATWVKGASATDAGGSFKAGATQLFWGLDAAASGFMYDDIRFDGISNDPILAVPQITITSEECISEVYYNLSGQQVIFSNNLKGIYLVKRILADGSVVTEKILLK